MATKKRGLGAMLLGFVAGAAATYLSNPKNREKAVKKATELAGSAKELAKEYKKNPTKTKAALKKAALKTANELVKEGKAGALKKVAKASKKVRKAKKLLS